MGIVSVCLDCPHYQNGGWCRKKQKTVSALAPACEASKTPDEDLVDDGLKTCRKCGRVLPKENFSKNASSPDGLQTTCRDCAAEAFKAWQEKQKERKNPMKEEPEMETPTQTKRCPKCGRDLPRDAFYPKLEAKDGLQSYCKECSNGAKQKKKNEDSLWQLHDRLLSDNPDNMRKVCSKCGQNLPLDEFYIKGGKPHYMCKSCVKKYNVEQARKRRNARYAETAEAAQKAGVKVCKTCGRELPLDAFGGHAKTWDGKATVCKECMAAKLTKNRETRWTKGEKTVPDPIPAPMLDEGIKVRKAAPELPPLADIDTSGSLENYTSQRLVDELRARGYHVECSRPITVIESL